MSITEHSLQRVLTLLNADSEKLQNIFFPWIKNNWQITNPAISLFITVVIYITTVKDAVIFLPTLLFHEKIDMKRFLLIIMLN